MSAMTFKEFNDRLNGMEKLLPRELASAMGRAARLVQRTSQEKYLTGPRPLRLGVKTGRLRRSITTGVEVQGSKVIGVVGTNVVYARIHEYGGPIRRRGRTVGQMPERSFLRTAIRDRLKETQKMLLDATSAFFIRRLRGG